MCESAHCNIWSIMYYIVQALQCMGHNVLYCIKLQCMGYNVLYYTKLQCMVHNVLYCTGTTMHDPQCIILYLHYNAWSLMYFIALALQCMVHNMLYWHYNAWYIMCYTGTTLHGTYTSYCNICSERCYYIISFIYFYVCFSLLHADTMLNLCCANILIANCSNLK